MLITLEVSDFNGFWRDEMLQNAMLAANCTKAKYRQNWKCLESLTYLTGRFFWSTEREWLLLLNHNGFVEREFGFARFDSTKAQNMSPF
jgi:hypothetical protein